MWGSISISQLNTARSANRSIYPSRKNVEAEDAEREVRDKITRMKRMIRGEEKNNQQYGVGSIADSFKTYAEQLKESREKAKNTASQLKKLKYNFKDISGQIRRSKTSVSAKQVASAARREVQLLKMKEQSGKYDKEEISAAIEHAKSMERAAKKKARHLMEEELVKITDDAPDKKDSINKEEQIEAERDKALEEIDKKMQALEDELSEVSKEEMQEMQEEMEESQEQMQEMTRESMEEMTSDMLDEMGQAMKDMLEDAFSDLADSMFAITDFEMTEDDFKELVKKHRASEEKDMVKADMDYLKAMFDHYNKMLANAKAGASSPGADMSGMSGFSAVSMPSTPVEVNIPGGASVDISV